MYSNLKNRVQIRITFSNVDYFNLSPFIDFHKYYRKMKCFEYPKISINSEKKSLLICNNNVRIEYKFKYG